MRNAGDGRIFARSAEQLEVPDEETGPSAAYIHSAVTNMMENLRGIRRVLDDRTRPVDEYQPGGSSNSENVVEVLPQFDTGMAERIESVFYWGPPAATGTLQIGDITFAITIPARGWDVIAPVSFLLNRSDRRIMTLGTPGNMGMRLMGWADERY